MLGVPDITDLDHGLQYRAEESVEGASRSSSPAHTASPLPWRIEMDPVSTSCEPTALQEMGLSLSPIVPDWALLC